MTNRVSRVSVKAARWAARWVLTRTDSSESTPSRDGPTVASIDDYVIELDEQDLDQQSDL